MLIDCTFYFFIAVCCIAVASVPIPGGHSLHPVKNRGGSFDKVVDKNSPSYFHWANYTLNKTSPFLYFSSIFQSANLTKSPPPLFFTGQTTPLSNLSPCYFFTSPYFSIYTLNKTFSRGGRSPKWRLKLESEIGGSMSPKLGGKLCPISIPDLRG